MDASVPARVLGAEPDPVTRALIALYLEPLGYAVQVAPRVREALADLGEDGAAAFLCSERALEEASAAEREALPRALARLPVVVLLEPGAAALHTRGWGFVRERLTKPLRAEALLALLPGVRPPGTRPVPPGWPALSGAGSGAAGPLRGFEQLVAEMHLEPGLVRELVASFLERAPGYLDELSVCVTRGDLAGMERTAHTLKGMCGNLRFQHLVQLGETLRAAARGGDRAGIAHALEALRVELDTLYAALRERWMIEEE